MKLYGFQQQPQSQDIVALNAALVRVLIPLSTELFLFIAYFLRFPLVYSLDYQGAEEAAHAH